MAAIYRVSSLIAHFGSSTNFVRKVQFNRRKPFVYKGDTMKNQLVSIINSLFAFVASLISNPQRIRIAIAIVVLALIVASLIAPSLIAVAGPIAGGGPN